MTVTVDEFIDHYGTKGMKWGVKKAPRRMSSDASKVAPLRKRHPSELTNKQLKTANERANLEQNYNRLNPTKTRQGHEAVKGYLAAFGTAATVYAAVNSPLGKKLIGLGKKAIANEKLKRMMKVSVSATGPGGQLKLF
jgi:hypothetical protein